MGGAHHCSGPRLRNDLYCVEWDVKLYYTIPQMQYETMQWHDSISSKSQKLQLVIYT